MIHKTWHPFIACGNLFCCWPNPCFHFCLQFCLALLFLLIDLHLSLVCPWNISACSPWCSGNSKWFFLHCCNIHSFVFFPSLKSSMYISHTDLKGLWWLHNCCLEHPAFTVTPSNRSNCQWLHQLDLYEQVSNLLFSLRISFNLTPAGHGIVNLIQMSLCSDVAIFMHNEDFIVPIFPPSVIVLLNQNEMVQCHPFLSFTAILCFGERVRPRLSNHLISMPVCKQVFKLNLK